MDPKAVKSDLVLILDYGSQYTHLITRRIRSLNIFSLCISGTSSLETITSHNPKAVILSGGPHSVHSVLSRLVEVGEEQEYGRMEIEVAKNLGIFGNKKVGDKQVVWMSHGDEAVKLPDGFEVVARSEQGAVAAVENREMRFFGLQYHPEMLKSLNVLQVTHSPEGMDTLRYFLFDVWGVDSTVAATLVHKAIGDRLHCVFVDNGLLRYKERERVMETFESDLHLPVTCVDASNEFLDKLKGVVDPEMKRKIIGEFISIFDAFAHELEKKLGRKPAYLVQGTLYPDVIESCPPPGSGKTCSHTIKSHHNVGGLPKDMKLKLIEPLKLLFKDEVINDTMGPEEHVICALSGGVDSTVAATLVHKAIGDRLHCFYVCRYKERERVMETFESDLHLPVTCVDASNEFLDKLKGVVDPEMKRKIIGKEFISIFDAFAHELEKKLGRKPAYLVQGTLYPDVIESCPPPGSGKTCSHTIKSHHNVGGLPKDMKLKLIEPHKNFYLRMRPGLAVDEIFIQAIKDAGLYDSIWQAFAVFLPIRSVGVQGDQRTHSHVVALRAVTSQDGMTADWFGYVFAGKIQIVAYGFMVFIGITNIFYLHGTILNTSSLMTWPEKFVIVLSVNRVVQDITSKPPWE
ncbi:hypothetical protein DKX38_000758 [Salix brachista]|uniref:GMP synthase (glutamine-hydrolyzing) n=1 Tax=Salix brachista TaxID=2182728 RepID=A0A5N5P1F3_9ROSI|nr:hypothetical protein DKX38_000758 [Salix brachista]